MHPKVLEIFQNNLGIRGVERFQGLIQTFHPCLTLVSLWPLDLYVAIPRNSSGTQTSWFFQTLEDFLVLLE